MMSRREVTVPLIPSAPDEVRALYDMMRADLALVMDADVAALIALECVAHAASLCREIDTLTPRVLVLHGTDPLAMLHAARAIPAVLPGLPAVEVPLTLVSEQGWQGRSLAEWLDRLGDQGLAWAPRGVALLTGVECLRLPRGTYTSAAGSGSTRDYRVGKSENLAALLSGQPAATSGMSWSAAGAFVVLTALYDCNDHSPAALDDWGLIPELAALLAAAPWVRVAEAAAGPVGERAILERLAPVRSMYSAAGYRLAVSPEAVRWAAAAASERGETAAVAAAWIADLLRRRLIELLAAGVTHPDVALGPEDVVPPPLSRGTWHD